MHALAGKARVLAPGLAPHAQNIIGRMDQKDFTKRYAQRTRSSSADAADKIDNIVNGLLRRLRAGKPAVLPGLGALLPASSKPKQAEQPTAAKAAKESR